MKIYILLFLSLFNFHSMMSQNTIDISMYSEKYKKNSFLIRNKLSNITFSFNKKTSKVEAIETTTLDIVSLRNDLKATIGISFDSNSEIVKAKSPGAKVEKVCGNYHPDYIFHSDDQLCLYKIYFENAGEVKSFHYEVKYNDVRFLPRVDFSDHYPIEKSILQFVIPRGFQITLKEYNTESYAVKKKEQSMEEDSVITFESENIPAYNNEDQFLPPYSFLVPHIFLHPKSYTEDQKKVVIFETINDFYQWGRDMIKKGSSKTDSILPFVKKLTEGKADTSEKVKTIFNWVQNNIRYIAFEEDLKGYIPESADHVFLQKYGDCKGMANLLKTMLLCAGLNAHLVWVGTDDLKYDFSCPNLSVCDHMVCALFYNNRKYILDPTDSYQSFENYPSALFGKQILIENGDHYILDSIPKPIPANEMVYSEVLCSISERNLKGKMQMTFHGGPKENILYILNNLPTTDLQKGIEKILNRELPQIAVSNGTTSDLKNRDQLLTLGGNVELKSVISNYGNEVYLRPDPFNDLSEFLGECDSPLWLSESKFRKLQVVIDLPSDMILLKLPENKSFTSDLLIFKTEYKQEGSRIIYTKEFSTLPRIIEMNRLNDWNKALKLFKSACNQSIILQKKK